MTNYHWQSNNHKRSGVDDLVLLSTVGIISYLHRSLLCNAHNSVLYTKQQSSPDLQNVGIASANCE